MLAAAALAAIIAADFPTAQAQNEDEAAGRIVARLLEDGRVEFGWQPRMNGGWGARVLPSQRRFPADVTHNRWLHSGPVEVDGEEIGRIYARLSEDGRIEFAFTPTDGERIEPSARYFPTDARVGRWLRSSEIMFSVEQLTVAEMEEAILAVLFGGEPAQANYNDWGCPTIKSPDRSCDDDDEYLRFNTSRFATGGYAGGHSGWDAQTLSVVGNRPTRNEPFYSLTNGEVIFVGSESGGTAGDHLRLIAVWTGDASSGHITRYLHSRSICADIQVGDAVVIGQQLGIQGNSGVPGAVNEWDAEHVHVEMQTRRTALYGYGAGSASADRRTIDPVPTLYRSVANWNGELMPCGSELTTTTVANGQQMYRPGTTEVYVAKIVGNQRYKRLFLTGEIRDSYGHLRGREPATVSLAEFNSFSTSCFVRFGNDYYFLDVREGADRAGKFRISDGRRGLSAAGVVEAAIFDVHAPEINSAAFDSRSAITAAQAARMSCGN